MATISVRYNDELKSEAEDIADAIGLSLSNVISIFLNRFIAEKGFPFDVVVPQKNVPVFKKDALEEVVITAIKNAKANPELPKSAYIDSLSNIKYTE